MRTAEQKLAAKRFNKFLDRVAQAFLAVGLAITAASVASIMTSDPRPGSWTWGVLGAALVVSSIVVPYITEQED